MFRLTAKIRTLMRRSRNNDRAEKSVSARDDAVVIDERWEAERRAVAAFYAVHRRYPQVLSQYPSERRLAAWIETQLREQDRGRTIIARSLMLELTPGWIARDRARRALVAQR